MSAVLVNNSLDHSCFPETLEILAPLIELRDAQGRTILHHIAVTCAIKGRAASSKYYLEALLEYLVRSNTGSNSQSNAFEPNGSLTMKPIGLMRFMQEMVNARDKGGNTALNLVARIGNRSIISQLMEVQADPSIPNYKGMRPIDFGVGSELERLEAPSMSQMSSPSKSKAPLSKVEETSREMLPRK
jgi:ankyrin repeat protein